MTIPTYLDAVSSEPLHPAAREALVAAADSGYADPLRLHGPARNTRLLLDNARAAVAQSLGVRPDEVTFTSSGTQAVHLGLLGLLEGRARLSRRVVHSVVEHSAVYAAARWWSRHDGGPPVEVGVDRHARIDLEALASALDQPTGVVALQHASPEVGTLQPVERVADLVGEVPLFVDACATGARVPLPAGWDAAALSAHKWGGPAGVGVLLVRKGARWRPPFPTDDRVDPRVSGFENVPGALAAAAALQARVAERDELGRRHAALADRLRAGLEAIPDLELHGHPVDRLPNLVSFSCLYVDAEALVTELDRQGFSVASGSACTASVLEPSHVLVAMGALTHGNARVSFTRDADEGDVDRLLAVLPGIVADLRARLR